MHILYQLTNHTVHNQQIQMLSLQVIGEWRGTGKYLQVSLVSESIFRRPTMFPSTLLLMVAWISSLSIIPLRVVITPLKAIQLGIE